MAMTKCKECDGTVSTRAESCPHCGAKRPASMHPVRKAIYVVIALVFFSFVFTCVSVMERSGRTSDTAGNSATPKTPIDPATLAVANKPVPIGEQWSYSSDEDKMRKSTSHYAKLQSINSIELKFPYNRESNHGYIGLQDVPGQGKSIYLEVDKGQFDCNLYACTLTVKFDDGPTRKISANTAAAGAHNVVFLPYASTLANLKKSKMLTVEATFYGSGDRQLDFDVAGLKWP